MGFDKLIAVLDAGFVGANTVEYSDYGQIIATRNFVEGGTDVYKGSSHGFSVLSNMAADKAVCSLEPRLLQIMCWLKQKKN